MKTAILAIVLLGAAVLAAPTAAADWNPWCSSQSTSTVNWVQSESNCKVDQVQQWAYDLYCDLACP